MKIKNNNVRLSRRLLPPRVKYDQSRLGLRRNFPEGHWSTIQVNLELKGWPPAQIKIIRDLMHSGWSLSESLNQVAFRMGRCPINFS